MLGWGGILPRGLKFLVGNGGGGGGVVGGVEGVWQDEKESYVLLSMFAADVKRHPISVMKAYEVIYAIM